MNVRSIQVLRNRPLSSTATLAIKEGQKGNMSAQSCKARGNGLDEETSHTPVSHWPLHGTNVRKKASEVKSRKAPWSKKKEQPHGPEAGWAFFCVSGTWVWTDRLTALCKSSQVLVNMETAQNHSNVIEPFPHPWHGAELSHRGSHASSSVSLEPAPHRSKALEP